MTSQGSFFGFPWGGFVGCCLSHVWPFVTPWTIATGLPHSSLPPGHCSNPCPLSQGCYLTISSSAAPTFSCPQSFPASGAFPMSWLFASGGQSTGTSASASVLSMNIQGWFRIGLNSLQSKGLSRAFSSRDILKTASHTMSSLKCFHQSGQAPVRATSQRSLTWALSTGQWEQAFLSLFPWKGNRTLGAAGQWRFSAHGEAEGTLSSIGGTFSRSSCPFPLPLCGHFFCFTLYIKVLTFTFSKTTYKKPSFQRVLPENHCRGGHLLKMAWKEHDAGDRDLSRVTGSITLTTNTHHCQIQEHPTARWLRRRRSCHAPRNPHWWPGSLPSPGPSIGLGAPSFCLGFWLPQFPWRTPYASRDKARLRAITELRKLNWMDNCWSFNF